MKKVNLTNNNRYNAQGFVEALIAILITGIAAMGLMTVAANTIGQVIDNEISDQLSQEAVKGAAIMDYFIEEWNQGNRTISTTNMLSPGGNTFQNSIGSCFALDGDLGDPVISNALAYCNASDSSDSTRFGINPYECLSQWDTVSIDTVGSEDLSDHRDQMFRIICITPESDNTNYYIMVTKIFTGTKSCYDRKYNARYSTISGKNETCDMVEHLAVYTVNP